MANIKASKKDILTNKRNKDRNVAFKSKMKTSVKRAVTSIVEKAEDAETQTRTALKTIDKLVSKGVLHKKTAARKKSKLMKKVNTEAQKPAEAAEPVKAKKATAPKKAAPKKAKAADTSKAKSAKKTTKKSA